MTWGERAAVAARGAGEPAARAIVVLGCRVSSAGVLSPPAWRRAREGARAHASGVAPRVVVSGGRRYGDLDDSVEAVAIARGLVAFGVDPAAVELELASLSTVENVVCVAAMLGPGARVAVVTCDWHMPRALSHARRAGLDAFACPAASPRASPLARALRAGAEVARATFDLATWGRASAALTPCAQRATAASSGRGAS